MTGPLQVNRAGGPNTPPSPAHKPNGPDGPSFADTLSALRFSNHAQKRMQSREISLTDEGLARLSTAVDKAEKRGGKESLVLMDELAFIVNIRERLVVTAIDASQRGEGVFTQIDSVVIAGAD
jgi:flagellar operon protein